jgi:2-iminobutanoate/2-iminopropanoate deaminase
MDTEKRIIQSSKAPRAIGPYSVAVQAGAFVYTSGQLGLDPQSGSLVPGGIVAETRQLLTNLAAVLQDAGSGLERVVKTTVFLKDMADFSQMNAIYEEFFPEFPPARSAVAVAALPRAASIEIEAVALLRPAAAGK